MKLLILGLNYAPEPVGIGLYTAGLAEAFAQRGHQVSVIAGKPYYPQWRAYPGQPKGRRTTFENGVSVTRVPHYIPGNPTGIQRIAHHASFAVSAYGAAIAQAADRPDLVLAIAPSLISVPVAARAARRAGAPLWLHVQDLEIEAGFATGLLKRGSLIGRLAQSFERRVLTRAARISAISGPMCMRLAAMNITAAERISEFRNWSNGSFDFSCADPSAYRREWALEGRKIALYSGNIANKQGVETLIEAARILQPRKDIVFVICGEGPNRDRLTALAQGLGNVQLHGLQPAARMADLLSLADVHLLPQIASAADLVLPSKLANMLASGRPIVATAMPGTSLYAEVEGCGVNTPPDDPQAMADAVARLIGDPDRSQAMGKAAVERAGERWQQGPIIDRLERDFMALING